MRKEAGQTLLEILLAISVSVLILSAITVIVITSLNNTQFTKYQNLANQYSQAGLELVRKVRDSSWTEFRGLNSIEYCPTNAWVQGKIIMGLPCIPFTFNTTWFVRGLTIQHESAGCPNPPLLNGSKVISTTSWTDNKCPGSIYCHKVELVSCFYNINQITAP